MDFPQDLRYTKDHEWARTDGTAVTIGITAFAVDQLGDITMIDLPQVGDAIKKGEHFGVVESVKSTSDLYAPVDGVVKAINEQLEDAPELVNESPYGEGWMIKVEVQGALDDLLEHQAYVALVEQES